MQHLLSRKDTTVKAQNAEAFFFFLFFLGMWASCWHFWWMVEEKRATDPPGTDVSHALVSSDREDHDADWCWHWIFQRSAIRYARYSTTMTQTEWLQQLYKLVAAICNDYNFLSMVVDFENTFNLHWWMNKFEHIFPRFVGTKKRSPVLI